MPTIALATAPNEPHLAGLSSGLVNTTRQVGGAIGLAALTTVATAVAADASVDDTVRGHRIALLVAAGLAVVLVSGGRAARRRRTFGKRFRRPIRTHEPGRRDGGGRRAGSGIGGEEPRLALVLFVGRLQPGGDRMTEHQAADSGPGTADRANEVTPVEVFTAAVEAEVHRRVVGDRRHGLALPDPPAAG